MGLSGKIAIITGAGRGIGRAIAREYARRGTKVILASRTESQLSETKGLITDEDGNAGYVVTDVRNRKSIEGMLDFTKSRYGKPDILINNAGSFATIGPVSEVDPDQWWNDITTNLYGTFLCCNVVLPGMIERKTGTIINLIGGGTAGPMPYGSGYGSSKAAIMRFSETLAKEVKEHGITVFPMGPGLVRTEMTEYQLNTDVGKKWMSGIADAFDRHVDRPPEVAAMLAADLGGGGYNEFTGRAFNAGDDLGEIASRKDQILAEDLRTLRMKM